MKTLTEALGWTLIHSLWQGAAIAVLLWLIFRFFRIHSPIARYSGACTALTLIAIASVSTFLTHLNRGSAVMEPLAVVSRELPELSQSQPILVPEASPNAFPAIEPLNDKAPSTSPRILWLKAIVTLWVLGVAYYTLRFLFNWISVLQLRSRNTYIGDPAWLDRFNRLRHHLGITRPVALLTSSQLVSPVAFGWLKPTVMIPIGLITGLSARQVEAILVHELAHIRRHDYLINLAQNVLEILFFYHPAVRWISNLARKEREHCCDDIAAQHCGNSVLYARALTSLETMRSQTPVLSLAATDGPFVSRIRRLLGLNLSPPPMSPWPVAILAITLIAGISLSLLNAQSRSEKDGDLPDLATLIKESPAPKEEIIDALMSRKNFLSSQRQQQANEVKYGLLNPTLQPVNEELQEIDQTLAPLIRQVSIEKHPLMELLSERMAQLEAAEKINSVSRGSQHPEILAIQAKLKEAQRMKDELRNTTLPEISESAVASLIDLRLQRAELSVRYGSRHPKLIQLNSQLRTLEESVGIALTAIESEGALPGAIPESTEALATTTDPVSAEPGQPINDPVTIETLDLELAAMEAAGLGAEHPDVISKRNEIERTRIIQENFLKLQEDHRTISKGALARLAERRLKHDELIAQGLGANHPAVQEVALEVSELEIRLGIR